MENTETMKNIVGFSFENKDDQMADIDYKNIKILSRFISERGKIIPSRVSSLPISIQRNISKAIKRARILALIPFVNR